MFNFEDKPVYKASKSLGKEVYLLTKKLPKEERFGLIDQMRRAAISVSLNIAEGFMRGSKAERTNFLRMSQGSVGEVVTCLDLCVDLKYIEGGRKVKLYDQCEGVAKQLNALIFKT